MDTKTVPVSTIPALTRHEAMELAAAEYARTILAPAGAHAGGVDPTHRVPGMGRAPDGLAHPRVRGSACVLPGARAPGAVGPERRWNVRRRAHGHPGARPRSADSGRDRPAARRGGSGVGGSSAAHAGLHPVAAHEGGDAVGDGALGDRVSHGHDLHRDTWMHRGDIARATGRELVLTPDHDGRIVADVVAEWARRHGRPFRLVLEGPAGGEFVQGDDGEQLRLDAVEFCRVLSGRGRWRRTTRTGGAVLMETTTDRDRRWDLPILDVRSRSELHVQPVPGEGGRAAAVPHRTAADVPARVRRDGAVSSRSISCAGSRSVTSRPTSAAR